MSSKYLYNLYYYIKLTTTDVQSYISIDVLTKEYFIVFY
jgi:hypothetical protein